MLSAKNNCSFIERILLKKILFLQLIMFVLVSFSEAATSVSRHAITWTFDTSYTTGTFANGDPWVKENTLGAGVVITNINPYPQTTPRYKNGSMINVIPKQGTGYDEKAKYVPSLNVVHDPANDLPLTVPANSSLISTVGIEPASDRPALTDASVLTVLPANVTPASGDFRPPYAGTDKSLNWNTADIVWSRLPGLTPPSGGNVPSLSTVEANTERVWLLHEHTSDGRAIHPQNNMKEYGRDLSKQLQDAILRSLLNDSQSNKETLVIQLVQIGIDIYGCLENGMTFPANGGHNQGMKAPILYAGWLLNDSDILWYGDKDNYFFFQEDEAYFYVAQTEVDYTNSASWDPDDRAHAVPYDSSYIGFPEWGIRHKSYKKFDNASWDATYRNVTGEATDGHILAMSLMGLEDEWNWSPVFNYYKTRYYPIMTAGLDTFVGDMWRTYFGGSSDTQAPSVPTGLSSSNVGETSMDLSWNASSDNTAVTGYAVYLDSWILEDSEGNSGKRILINTDTNSATISGLTPGVLYTYTVKAYDAAGNNSAESSDFDVLQAGSIPDVEDPTTPTGFIASYITNNSLLLEWDESDDNIAVAGYYIYTNGENPIDVGNNLSRFITGLNPQTSYNFSVSAYDYGNNESEPTDEVNVTTLSGNSSGTLYMIIEDLDASGSIASLTYDSTDVTSSTTVTPSTTASGSTNLSSQTIQFDVTGLSIDSTGSGDDSLTFSIIVEAWGVTANSSTPSLSYNTAYAFSTDNTTRWGNTGALPGGGAYSSSTQISSGEGLTYSFVSGSVSLGSGMSSSNGDYQVNMGGFEGINYDNRSAPATTVIDLGGTISSLPDASNDAILDLQNVTSFGIGSETGAFRLRNLDFLVGVALPASADTTAPSTPTNLGSSNITASSVDLSWDSAQDNVGVAGYYVYTNGANPINIGNNLSATVSSLSASTSYTFTVSAYDAIGNESSPSNGVNVTTLSSITPQTIIIENLNANGGVDSVTVDSIDKTSSTTVTPDTTACGYTGLNNQTIEIEITGLTIDGTGTANDSVTFSILVEAWGVTVNAGTPSMTLDSAYTFSVDNTSRWGNTGASGGGCYSSSTQIGAGEGLSFSFVEGSVELNGSSSQLATVVLEGFDAISYDQRTGTPSVVILKDSQASALSTPTSSQTIDLAGALEFAIGTSSGGFRLDNLDLTLTIEAP